MSKQTRDLRVLPKTELIILENLPPRKWKTEKRGIFIQEESEESNLSARFFHHLPYDAGMNVPFFF